MSGPVYEIENLELRFGERLAMRCQGLSVPEGSIVGIRGPNGAGKSTLLSVMAFLEEPTAGVLRFLGREVRQGDVALRRQAVLMPQDPALLRRKVRANVLYGLGVRGVRDPDAAGQAMELVGLNPERYLNRWWWELSGGETRRVALAARLALRPRVLLLDEPTASLDPESSELVAKALLAAKEQRGLTVVAVSHDSEWLDAVSDELYHLAPQTGISTVRQERKPCAR